MPPFDDDELTYDAPPPAEDELTFDEPPTPAKVTARVDPAWKAPKIVLQASPPVSKPVDPTEGMSFLQKADAAAARGIQGIGSAAGLFARRMGLVKPEDDLAAAKNFLGRDLTTEEAQRVRTNGLEALVAPVQTAPNKGLVNRAANIVGGLAPAIPAMVAGGPLGGALAFGAQAAGGEQQASAEAGEDPEIQAARAKLAFAINAPAALVPGSSLGLTKLPARMAAQALSGAAVGAGTSALGDVVQQRPVDLDAAGTNAILMVLMGAAHQALATPKAAKEIGTKWSELTGKSFETPEAAVADLQRFTRKVEAEQTPAPAVPEPGRVLETKQSRTAYELFKQDLAEQEAAKQRASQEMVVAPEVAEDPITFDTRHAELFHQGEPTAGTQLSLSELSALTPDQFAARYGDVNRPGFVPPQAESIRLGNEAATPAQVAELKRLADQHSAAVEAQRAEVLASGDPERIQQQLALDLHADLFRKAYEHATGPERGMTPEQVIAQTGKEPNALPVKSPNAPDVRQAPVDRPTMGEGVSRDGREVASGTQGRDLPAQALRATGPAEVSAPVEPAGGGVTPPKPPRSGPPELGEPSGGPPRPPEWTPPVPADKWGQMTAHVRRLYRENVKDTGKAFVNAFSRMTRMEGIEKTPVGQDITNRFSKAATEAAIDMGTAHEATGKSYEGLTAADRQSLRDGTAAALYQKGGVGAMPTPGLRKVAEVWSGVSDGFADKTEGLGVEIADQRVPGGFRPFRKGNVPNYFPREGTKALRDAMLRGKGEVYDAVVDMLQRKNIPLASLESLLDVDASGARRNGNIESPRLGEMEPEVVTKSGERVKILNTNWFTAVDRYIESAAKRLSIIKHFGDFKEDGTWVSGQKAAENIVDGAVKSLDGQGYKAEARRVAETWSALNGTQNQAALKWLRAHKLETPIATGEAIARTAMLTGATPSQFATGWVPIATRFGTAGTAKSIARQVANAIGLNPKTPFEQHLRENTGVLAQDLAKENLSTKGLLKLGREAGATAKDTLGHTYTTEDIAGSAQKASNAVLGAVGFNASNRFLNSVSVLASAENLAHSIQIIREGKTGAVRKLWGMDAEGAAKGLRDNFDFTQADIDRMADTGITKNDLAQAMQRGTSKTNLFRETVFERPPWMNAVLARKMMAYTSYARAMGNTLSDALSAARSGNVRPIATLLVGGTVGGAALKEFKDLLFRKPDQPDKDALDTAARLLEYQMNASIYGLAGSYAQTIGYGIKRGDFSGPGSAMLDWWLKNAAGAVKSAKAGELTPSYEAFARSTPIVKAADAWLGGPLSQKKGGPAVQELQQKAREFKSSLPGRGPDDPKFKDLVEALKANDRQAARRAIVALRRSGGSEGVRRSLEDYANYTFTGSKETEAAFLRTLTPQQRATYDALLRARRDIARRGQAMVR